MIIVGDEYFHPTSLISFSKELLESMTCGDSMVSPILLLLGETRG